MPEDRDDIISIVNNNAHYAQIALAAVGVSLLIYSTVVKPESNIVIPLSSTLTLSILLLSVQGLMLLPNSISDNLDRPRFLVDPLYRNLTLYSPVILGISNILSNLIK